MRFTIRQLRRAGFKVRVLHTRHYDTVGINRLSGPVSRLSCKGGRTRIQITTPDKEIDVEGVAECSLQDSFNRKVGNSIALGRAIQELQTFPKIKDLLDTI